MCTLYVTEGEAEGPIPALNMFAYVPQLGIPHAGCVDLWWLPLF